MVCLRLESRAGTLKPQTNPLSYGGIPTHLVYYRRRKSRKIELPTDFFASSLSIWQAFGDKK